MPLEREEPSGDPLAQLHQKIAALSKEIVECKLAGEDLGESLQRERDARAEAERVTRMNDEFLATLSHELRTPLNAILGWTALLERKTLPPDAVEGVQVIARNARIQKQLIEDLLDRSRIIAGKVRLDVQRVELGPVIEAAIGTVRPSADVKDVRLQVTLDSLAGPVKGDPNRLQQVMWNLLSNAIKFTPPGGRVQISLERVNSHVEIIVADSGEGIKPELLPNVFDRFRQADSSSARQYGGLGLGLSIVKNLVELHGGTVRAKSPGEGQGSTFVIALPVMLLHGTGADSSEDRVHPTTPVNSQEALRDAPTLRDIDVLVVDDELDARDLVKRLLESCEASVRTAGSAMEALALISEKSPDVLVSDIGMPEIDGYALIRRVRMRPRVEGGEVPAVALTAFARSEDRMRAMIAGYNLHLAKPIEPSELVVAVASLAGRTGRQLR